MSMEIHRWNKPQKPDAGTLRSQLENDGFSVFEWSDAPGTVYETHVHDTDQSHWVISGELELKVKSDTYKLRAGDRDFLPAHTAHSAFVPGNEPVRYLIGVKNS
jgi:mannose-6-phosphate isomerase-like protein (cupin superfamily)